MEKFQFNKVVKGEEIKDMVEKELGLKFRYELKKMSKGWSGIKIVQDRLRGCWVSYKEKEGRTICQVYPYTSLGPLLFLLAYTPTILIELIFIVFFGKILVGDIMLLILTLILPMTLLWIMISIQRSRSRNIYQRIVGIIKNSQYIES